MSPRRGFSLAGQAAFPYGNRAGPGLTDAPVELTAKQKQHLRALAHPLKPLVQIGAKGIQDSLIQQITEQLVAHELIKVRFNTESSVEPADAVADLVTRTRSQLVQHSGRILVLYRRHPEKPKIELPKAKGAPRSGATS